MNAASPSISQEQIAGLCGLRVGSYHHGKYFDVMCRGFIEGEAAFYIFSSKDVATDEP